MPKVRESTVAHVRPHGRDGDDKATLPDGRMMTKQCFWLNNSYIKAQIMTGLANYKAPILPIPFPYSIR